MRSWVVRIIKRNKIKKRPGDEGPWCSCDGRRDARELGKEFGLRYALAPNNILLIAFLRK